MSTTVLLFLLFVPTLIGIIAGFALWPWATFPWWSILKWGAILIVGGWVLSKVFPRFDETSNDQPLHRYDPWGDLQSGHVEQVNKNTTIVHAEGYAFEVTNRFNGDPMVREVDPSNKAPISGWTAGSHRDVKGKAHSVANHIKYTVNTRKGRGGN